MMVTKIKEYNLLVIRDSIEGFNRVINGMIKKGWTLYGNHTINYYIDNSYNGTPQNNLLMTQAFVKWESIEQES